MLGQVLVTAVFCLSTSLSVAQIDGNLTHLLISESLKSLNLKSLFFFSLLSKNACPLHPLLWMRVHSTTTTPALVACSFHPLYQLLPPHTPTPYWLSVQYKVKHNVSHTAVSVTDSIFQHLSDLNICTLLQTFITFMLLSGKPTSGYRFFAYQGPVTQNELLHLKLKLCCP